MTDSLIANAVLSLDMGVEDYKSDRYARSLSAIRNIYAGILLLCKEVLVRHSPEGSNDVLIKSKIIPVRGDDNTVQFIGTGRKTVDRTQIKERFDSLGLALDWKLLDRISEIRNDIEHFYSEKPEPLLREALSDTFVLVRSLVVDHLNEMPIALLGKKTWQILLEANEVFIDQHQGCMKTFRIVSFSSPTLARASLLSTCPSCGSPLIMQLHEENTDEHSIQLFCSACGALHERDDIFEVAIMKEMEVDNYISFNEKGEMGLHLCPECNRQSYIVSESKCALCGFCPD